MTIEEAIDAFKKDIKCCIDNPCSGPCENSGCPYFIGDNDLIEAEKLAIEALEKQILKEPILWNEQLYVCPNCNHHIVVFTAKE